MKFELWPRRLALQKAAANDITEALQESANLHLWLRGKSCLDLCLNTILQQSFSATSHEPAFSDYWNLLIWQ